MVTKNIVGSNMMLLLKLVAMIHGESSMSDLAAFLASSVYKPQYVTSVVWTCSQIDDVTEFLKHFHGSVVTSYVQSNNNHKTRELNKAVGYKQTVLFAVSAEEFAYFITSVNMDLVTPIRLLLVLPAFVEDLSLITRTAWANDLADIVIISRDQKGNISLTTYFPYGKGICGDYTPVALNMNTSELFAKKFGNFYGCPIKTALVDSIPYLKLEMINDTISSITGIDGRIFMYVIESLNATIDVVSTEDLEGMGSFVNNTPTGCFGDLVNKDADIIAPAAVINYKRYSLAQISHVYNTLDLHWCAPNRRKKFNWFEALLPLLDYITLYIFLTLIIFAVVTSVIKRRVLQKSKTENSVFFQAYVILMGQEVKFETKSYLVNYLFVLWLWFCFVFRIAYQCDLIDDMTYKTVQNPSLGSLENALKVVEGYGGLEEFYDFYSDSPLGGNFKVLAIQDVVPYIKAISEGKRFLILTDVLLVKEFNAQVQILDEPVSRTATCLFMRPGWPAAKEVDVITQHIIEMGFTVQVMKDYHDEFVKKRHLQKEEQLHPHLDLQTLSACFCCLVIMWILTTIIFFIELTYPDKQKNIK